MLPRVMDWFLKVHKLRKEGGREEGKKGGREEGIRNWN